MTVRLPKLAEPKDPVNLLALQKIRARGRGPERQPISGARPGDRGPGERQPPSPAGPSVRPAERPGPLLSVNDLHQVVRLSNRLFRDLVDVRSVRDLSKDDLANRLVTALWDWLLSLEFSPVSGLPINPSRPAM